jgi:hypothetical protein
MVLPEIAVPAITAPPALPGSVASHTFVFAPPLSTRHVPRTSDPRARALASCPLTPAIHEHVAGGSASHGRSILACPGDR